MPVIADNTDEPPAKCCKYCEESTHGVDEPVSWRLTLDQDLIDTLKGSFPNWFSNTNNNNNNNNNNSNNNSSPTTLITTTSSSSSSSSSLSLSLSSSSPSSSSSSSLSSSSSSSSTSSLSSLSSSTSPPPLITTTIKPSALAIKQHQQQKRRAQQINNNNNNNNNNNCNSGKISTTKLNLSCNGAIGGIKAAKSQIAIVNKSYQNHKNNNNNHNNNNSLILLHDTFDGMAEGERLCNPSVTTNHGGPSSIILDTSVSDNNNSTSMTTLSTVGGGIVSTIVSAAVSGTTLLNNNNNNNILNNLNNNNCSSYDPRNSPPKAIVDSSPLQPAMDKNKESLKVKLMVRRPITQLVEQGIIPPLNTSPTIHEQCKQLERAKTGDLLKAKIQQRPNRQELERRHILEHEECHVDPSLAERQRMLKKARLADQLNSQISHRPGPLELIKKNILHTEKPIERIVKEGLVTFKATSEGLLNRPQQPNSYITFEDDSQSSESDTRNTPPRQDVIEAAATSAGIVTVALTIPTSGGAVVVTPAPVLQTKFHPTLISTPYIPPPPPPPPVGNKNFEQIQVKQDTSNLFAELCQSVTGQSQSPSFLPLAASPASLVSSTSTLSPLSSVASPPQSLTPRPVQSPLQQNQQSQKSDAPGKDKNRKKSKSKPVSKARTIKFHEYKGPPNAQKISGSDSNQPEETSYQLMLEQQNCLLRFLEKLNKNQTILPAPPKSTSSVTSESSNSVPAIAPRPPPLPSPALSISSSVPPSPAPSHAESISSDIMKLEKMKVSDLKVHLKKRNLPISGPKTQLIERLKPFLPLEAIEASNPESVSGETCDVDLVNSPRHSMSPESEHENMEVQQTDVPSPMVISLTNEDIVREQQRKIDELQRQLQRSQQELQQIKQNQHKVVEAAPPPPPINQKLVVKQQLEAKIQKQQANRAAQLALKNKTPALLVAKEEKSQQSQKPHQPPAKSHKPQVTTQIPIAAKPSNNVGILWSGENQTVFLVGLPDKKLINGHQRAASLPSIVFPFPTTQAVEQVIETKPILQQPSIVHESMPPIQVDIKPPPPLYEEATKQLSNVTVTVKEEPGLNKYIKSENLTDVLDILIKNGELPESALDPTTPTITGQPITQNLIFSNNGAMDVKNIENNSQIHSQQQIETDTNNIFQTSILLDAPSAIENIEMASPMQPDCHIDTENVAKTLDIFLEPQQQERPLNNSEINHFDDLELLELMSQQLDMDISDETCHNFPSSPSNSQHQQFNKLSTGVSVRRDMNPSLQPSINELIQQQQQQQQHHHHHQQQRHNNNNSSTNSNTQVNRNNANNNTTTSNFCGSELTNGFDVDQNNFDLTNGNTSDYHHSTPMDVCDDFDNPLSNFDFPNLSQDTNINTPPHPFSPSLPIMNDTTSSSGSGQHNISCSSFSNNGIINHQLYNCTATADSSDSFGSHLQINQDNILDLFNIDDYKMTWSEVDFAV